MELRIEELVGRARGMAARGTRAIVGIAGAPGAGKSTLAVHLARALGPARAAHVPMDGFHLADRELRRLGRQDRKGAPDTFDAAGYVALLARLRVPEPGVTVYAPAFDRELEQPVAGSIPVAPEVPLVITEGNYLLLGAGDGPAAAPWAPVRGLLDEVWWVALDDPERIRRLVDRHERFGKERGAAERWVRRSDEANARLIAPTARAADLVVRYAPGGAPRPD